MIVENNNRIKALKRVFYIGAGSWAISSLVFFLIGRDLQGFIAAGILLVWFLIFQFIDFQYVYFELTEEKLVLRFYSMVKFGRKDYQTIEFSPAYLYDYRIEKSVFGRVEDLILVIKSSRGIAEYPPVSLAALDRTNRQIIERNLKKILHR